MAVRRLAEAQPESFAFSPDNRAWAEREVAKFPEGRQASAVIALLWRVQEQEGWVTKPAIEHVAEMLAMPTIRVLEVATFYTMFHLEPVGERAHVQVCGTTPCMLRGAGEIIDVCRRRIHAKPHHRSADGAFSWEEVECLGACVNAPMVQIFADTYEDLTTETFEAVLDAFARGETPRPGPQDGRQYSMPVTGQTTLTEIEYAEDDVPRARAPSTDAAARPALAGRADEKELHTAVDETAGGEEFEAERQRRRGRVVEKEGRTDLASGQAAEQKIGYPDASGRSDEAASRAMGARAEGMEEKTGAVMDQVPERRSGVDRSAQPRTDRDYGGKDD